MKTYKIVMSDGQRWDKIAHSAGDAIQWALESNPGHKVLECWAGDRFADSDLSGVMMFEVPPHEPFIAPPKVEKVDPTELLFDTAESVRLGVIKPGRD